MALKWEVPSWGRTWLAREPHWLEDVYSWGGAHIGGGKGTQGVVRGLNEVGREIWGTYKEGGAHGWGGGCTGGGKGT
jgi:hypothetical protein